MNNFYENNAQLVSLTKEGDTKAYNYIVENYHEKIFAYAFSLTNNYALAQDIVQNVFLKTWEFRRNLDPIYPIKSFLYKSTYNEFVNNYHKNKAVSRLEQKFVDLLDQFISEENDDILIRKTTIVNTEIEKLPAKCKEVFLLSKKEGLTNTEIASHLSISIKAVEGQITRAYSILRKSCLEKIQAFLFLLFGSKIKPF
ncbi:RNA polymerase sigma factor [Aestuariibaculum marinum]|uniref:Sigma-70 family RNA polymerase sigma factor n=1 Tax=Aestuariibaculum marinum TaxID=2683592 RepID=A0A8J6Q746_9FLAO|nr:sigma-70 family RNA polymerase sigma factor [Aestuariibaculum marinum]MBD0825459.1 sigma-70 family RNA polymerase sigma factor [Aestuariibaculum marinum]